MNRKIRKTILVKKECKYIFLQFVGYLSILMRQQGGWLVESKTYKKFDYLQIIERKNSPTFWIFKTVDALYMIFIRWMKKRLWFSSEKNVVLSMCKWYSNSVISVV